MGELLSSKTYLCIRHPIYKVSLNLNFIKWMVIERNYVKIKILYRDYPIGLKLNKRIHRDYYVPGDHNYEVNQIKL